MSGPCGVWTRAKCTFCLSLTQADNSSIIYCPGSVQLQRPAARTKESLTLCPALDSAAASICFVNNSPLYPKRGIIYSGLLSFCSDQGCKEKMHCSSEPLEGIRVEGGMDNNSLCPHLGGADCVPVFLLMHTLLFPLQLLPLEIHHSTISSAQNTVWHKGRA